MFIVDRLFAFFVGHRTGVIRVFKIVYAGLILLLIAASVSSYRTDSWSQMYYMIALWCGKTAIPVYIATTLPGVFRRFRIVHKLVSLLMIYRRYIGILMYLLVLVHYVTIRLMPMIKGHINIYPRPLYEIVGFFAFFLLFFLFVTSNDLSVKTLGIWWNRIHKATYIALWFIFLHVALQRMSLWTVLMGASGVVQVASFMFVVYRRHVPLPPQTSS